MEAEARISPPNSLLLVMDRSVGIVPDSMEDGIVVSTTTCVAVGTLAETDGQTRIILTDENVMLFDDYSLIFEGILQTPSKRLSICTVMDEEVLSLEVSRPKIQITIWVNDDSEPNEIFVLVVD